MRIHRLDWLLLSMLISPVLIPMGGKALKFYWSDLVVFFLTCLLITEYIASHQIQLRVHKIVVWMIALSLLILTTMPDAYNIFFSLLNAKIFIAPFLVFIIAYSSLKNTDYNDHIVFMLVIIAWYFCITALYNWNQFITGKAVLQYGFGPKDMIQNAIGRSNSVAGVCALLLPFGLYVGWGKSKYFKLFSGATIIILLITIMFAMSRASILAAFTGFLVCLFLGAIFGKTSKIKKGIIVSVTGVLLVVISLISGLIIFLPQSLQFTLLGHLFKAQSIVSSGVQSDARLATWSTALSNINTPFGIGLGNFTQFINQYKANNYLIAETAHNMFLEIFIELGVLGLFFLLVILLYYGVILAKSIKYAQSEKDRRLAICIAMSYAIYLVNVFFEPNYYSPTFTYLFSIMMAMAFVISESACSRTTCRRSIHSND